MPDKRLTRVDHARNMGSQFARQSASAVPFSRRALPSFARLIPTPGALYMLQPFAAWDTRAYTWVFYP